MTLHLATLGLFALLALVAAIDLRSMRIPDMLNATIMLLGFVAGWLLNKPLAPALIGIAAGYGALLALNFAYRTVRGRDGLGMGDAKLLAAAGAWLGWSGLPFVVLIASATGIVYVAATRIAGRALGGRDALAFGPFLCVGFFVVWVAQNYALGLAGY